MPKGPDLGHDVKQKKTRARDVKEHVLNDTACTGGSP